MEWAQELVSVVQNSEGIVRIKAIECIEEIFRHDQSQSDNKYEELQDSLVKMWLIENNWITPAFSSLVRTIISCNSESGSY